MPIFDVIQQLVANSGKVDLLNAPCLELYGQAQQIALEIEERIEVNSVSPAQVYPHLILLFCQQLQTINFPSEDSWTKTRDKIVQWHIPGCEDSQHHVIKETLLLALHYVFIQQAISQETIDDLTFYATTDCINYYQAWVALQVTLADLSITPTLKPYGKKLLEQIGLSKGSSHISLAALTMVLAVVNQTIKTHTPLNTIESMDYYRTRLALEDTLAKQQKNQVVRVAGKSILEQIVRLKGSSSFPLAELSTVLEIINKTINAQDKNNNKVASLIQYFQARLALQETLSKQRVDQLLKHGGEELLKQITQLEAASELPLDELTESLEVVNEIINIQTGTTYDAMDRLDYERARLRLRTTLTRSTTAPLLKPYGVNVLAHTEQLKKSVNRTASLSELTQVLELSNQAIEVPNLFHAQACLDHGTRIAPHTNRKFKAALLGLVGAVILAASVGAALATFGAASPVSLVVFAFGVSIIAQAISIGAGVVGASMVGRSLFTLFKPKPLPETLKGDMVNLYEKVRFMAG